MGDGIGHVAVTGVAIGLFTGTSPVVTAVVVAIVAAVVIEVVRERGAASGDVALALLFYGGIAGGVFLTGLAGQNAATLNRYLFGSITTVGTGDLVATTRARRRRGRRRARARAAALRRRPRPRLRPRRRAARALVQPAGLGAGGGLGHRRDADRRPAAGERADGGAGGDRPAALPQLPHHPAGRDGAGHRRLRRRRRRSAPTSTSPPAPPSSCWRWPASPSPGRSASGLRRHRRVRQPFPEVVTPALGAEHVVAETTSTSTGPTAATPPCPTATTSTTSTTGTATPLTEVTMTSTDTSGLRPTRQRRAVATCLDRVDDFRSAQEIHALLQAA